MRLHLSLLCTAIGIAAPNLAYASAWTQEAGKTQTIVTGSYYTADRYWNNQGKRQSQPDYHKYALNPYIEYGWRDDITFGANLSLETAHQDAFTGGRETNNWGLGDSEFFVRKRLFNRKGFVVSAEPMVKLPSPESSKSQPRIGSSNPDIGFGLSGGYGFSAYGQNHFADVDTQYRYRMGSPSDQVRISGTLGIGLSDNWMLMPQTFMTYRTADSSTAAFTQSSGDDYNLIRMQLSAKYKLTDSVAVQFGGFKDVDGKNTGTGTGALLALWTHM